MAAEYQTGRGPTRSAAGQTPAQRWLGFVTSKKHRDIGALYLAFAIAAGVIGCLVSLLHAGLIGPDLPLLGERHRFDVLGSGYGLIMAFFVILPALIGGFGGLFVPAMIGAPEMAFPRMNGICFWLLALSFVLLVVSLFVTDDAALSDLAVGRRLPASPGATTQLAIVTICIAGASSVLAAVNFVTTILNMRAPAMTLHAMPLFVWSILVTAIFLLLWLPVLAGAVTVLSTERDSAIGFLGAAGGSARVRYGQVFWFLGHPEFYVLILPSFGVISQIVSTFSKRPVVGHLAMAYAMVAVGFVGFVAWAHQLYAAGYSADNGTYFRLVTLVIVVATAISAFSWLATMWRGTISLRAPMLWAIGFIFLFTIGGVTGALRAEAGVGTAPQDAYYIAAHFQHVLSLGAMFAVFASWYYWFPNVSGLLYNEALAKLHFWLTFMGVNLALFTQHFLGLAGVLRRYIGYPHVDSGWYQLSTVGAYLIAAGLAIFVLCMVEARLRGHVANRNPWKATTLEWTMS